MSDLKCALRQLRKHPGFTLVAVVTLALGIGANTAIFSFVDRLMVRSLPVDRPHELVVLGIEQDWGGRSYTFNYPLFEDYRRENSVFTHLVAQSDRAVGFSAGGPTERARALLVSKDYFEMLGVRLALGGFGSEPGPDSGVVISHGLWWRVFGADPSAIGRGVSINGQPFTITGIAPREFIGTEPGTIPDLYLPITALTGIVSEQEGFGDALTTRFMTWHEVMGRLKPGVPRPQAQEAMRALARQIEPLHSESTSTNLLVLPGHQGLVANVSEARLPMALMLGAVGMVLLVACANVAGLQLARAASRQREFAVRLAVGAGRGRVARQVLTETLLVALAGGAAGLLVAVWVHRALLEFQPGDMTNTALAELMRIDWRVLLFTLGVTTMAGILSGMAPAFHAARPDLLPALKSTSEIAAGGARRWTLRRALVTGQVMLATVCVVCAGLCARSLQKLMAIDPGFEPSRVLAASLDLQYTSYPAERAQAFYQALLERVRALPGVEAASLARSTPLGRSHISMSVERIDGYVIPPNEYPNWHMNVVTPDYFRTLGLRLLSGRDFSAVDRDGGARVIVINETTARLYWPHANPVGRRIYQSGFDNRDETTFEIIGVVSDARQRSLNRPAQPEMYWPLAQQTELGMTLLLRSSADPKTLAAPLADVVRELEPGLPLFAVRTLEEQRDASLALQRMATTVLGGFGMLALLLAALGLYGLLAFSVARRRQEIGLRMALGADARNVVRWMLGVGLWPAMVGVILGVALALAAGNAMRGFLHETVPHDPLTLITTASLLMIAALLACYLPARRAAGVDPMEALRTE